MRGGTLFSGIGAPEIAAPWIDWRWSAEIDPFASAVHTARWPHIPNLGDVTEIDWHAVEPVDIVVAGPPCQDHSVAGPRAGLAGERGNLSLVYADILDAVNPVWSLTENVPGWLSLSDNAFGEFLGRLVGSDAALVPGRGQRWTDAGVAAGPKRAAAWRTLDAQYFGVAQRRRRVFVLAVRGAGADACAAALFPVVAGMYRDFAPRRETWKGASGTVAGGAEGGGGRVAIKNINGARGNGARRNALDQGIDEPLWTLNAQDQHGVLVAPTLPARKTAGGGMGTDFDCDGGLVQEIADPITANEGKTWSHEGNNFRLRNVVTDEVAGSLIRLTPREAERLQGFPDDWTLVEYRGKAAADGPRYRALGNSMAVPCVAWLLGRVR